MRCPAHPLKLFPGPRLVPPPALPLYSLKLTSRQLDRGRMAQQLEPASSLAGPQSLALEDSAVEDLVEAQMRRELELLIDENVNRVLEYHLTHRPSNTAKNYIPKQREWKVSSPPESPTFQANSYVNRHGASPRYGPQEGHICLGTL